MEDNFQFFIEDRFHAGTYAIYGRKKGLTSVRYVEKVSLGEDVPIHRLHEVGIQPFMEIGPEQAQELFNKLWQLGFRPKDGTGNGGHIEALKYHLEDMRRLVFDGAKEGNK